MSRFAIRDFRRLSLMILVSIAGSNVQNATAQPAGSGDPALSYAAQGWSEADRNIFYTTSQGSHMMPYIWFKALRRTDNDQPFAGDQLQRYGYLPNSASASNPEGLPVGFVIDGTSGQVGMTCAACHTAQLEYKKDGVTHALRLDGAPASADFQQFLTDLLAASRATLAQPTRFDTFVRTALGTSYTAARAAQEKARFGKWVGQFGEFMDRSLPTSSPWGPGRLDAFGMIFNRVAARDLGVARNFKVADAPVSYPFLWNASRQDHTQWNGGVPNGLYVRALGRNAGEVFGVFADFAPRRVVRPTPVTAAAIDYRDNSVKFAGLQILEEKIVALQPPPWPREIFGFDNALAEIGKPLFEKHCAGCHGVTVSPELPWLWNTPVKAVGTDPRVFVNAMRMSDAGLLAGALLPPPAIGRISGQAKTVDILGNVVIGSLVAEALIPRGLSPANLPSAADFARSTVIGAIRKDFAEHFPDKNVDALLNPNLPLKAKLDALRESYAFINTHLGKLFNPPPSPEGPAYESRVLSGIWATAPFLHNGSVPNLWELMKPARERKTTFMVGSRFFDPKNVGYATDETPFRAGAFVADPANGNGNGGHEYGTTLTEEQRWAIIEYLKTL